MVKKEDFNKTVEEHKIRYRSGAGRLKTNPRQETKGNQSLYGGGQDQAAVLENTRIRTKKNVQTSCEEK